MKYIKFILAIVIFSHPLAFSAARPAPPIIPPESKAVFDEAATIDMLKAVNKQNYKDLKNILATQRPNIDAAGSRDKITSLGRAVMRHDLELVTILLQHGANPSLPVYGSSEHLSTPLHEVVEIGNEGDVPIINALLDHKADLDARDEKGDTPLMIAANMESPLPIVRALLDRGADISVKNKEGKTALDIAQEKRNGPLIQLLNNYIVARSAALKSIPELKNFPPGLLPLIESY